MPLYIVATPIGNLEDISFRAIETLKTVNLILAEDTRHSKKLLNTYNIDTPMQAFHEHNETNKTPAIIDVLLAGKNIALISDAGTPLINDPGYTLVNEAKKVGITVSPIPGACAMISALSCSGITSNQFTFFGFLPSKSTARIKALQAIAYVEQTCIFYESPKRILACAKDLLQVYGDKKIVCFAKEISKSFENIHTNTLPKIIDYLTIDEAHQKGEFVILITGIEKNNNVEGEKQLNKILPILLTEMSASKAAKLAAKITGINKQYCYQRSINLKESTSRDD